MGQENKYISQHRSEGLPPGAPSASEGWSAMVQLLDEEMPLRKNGEKYLLLLILILLFIGQPPANRSEGKQKALLASPEGHSIKIDPVFPAIPLTKNVSVVHAREIRTMQNTTRAEINGTESQTLPDTSLNLSHFQQMNKRDHDNSRIIAMQGKKDSADKNEPIADDATELEIQTGLSWSLPMPVGGTQNYFAGPNGTSQPFRYALPGAWISLRAENYLFTASVNPFASSMVQPAVIDSSVNVPDSLTRIVKTNSITKLFGIVAALHIDHRIGGNWWAGGALQGNWWQEAVSTVHSKTEKILGPGSISYQTSAAKLPDSAWANLSRFQIFLNGELIYRTTNWQTGVEAGLSVTPLANSGNPKNLFNAAIFFRLPIITKQIKVKEDP